MKESVFITMLSLLSIVSFAQNNIAKQKFHFGREQDTTAGYAQAVKVDNVLYISGTVGAGSDAANALRQVYSNLERTLKHYGATC